MLHALEVAQRVADDRRGDARRHGHGRGRQGVFQVVLAGNIDLIGGANGLVVLWGTIDDVARLHESPEGHRIPGGEPGHLALHAAGHVFGDGVVPVQHHHVVPGAVFKDALLQRYVLLHRAVAIQVILRDVQHRTDRGMEVPGGLHHEG